MYMYTFIYIYKIYYNYTVVSLYVEIILFFYPSTYSVSIN